LVKMVFEGLVFWFRVFEILVFRFWFLVFGFVEKVCFWIFKVFAWDRKSLASRSQPCSDLAYKDVKDQRTTFILARCCSMKNRRRDAGGLGAVAERLRVLVA
jgi:hypothetical protein